MKSIDLNCDLGELMPGKTENYDGAIMPFISSCNIACGFHSGNPALMEKTIRLAAKHGVRIGAHPSYNDRENFGRLSMNVDRQVLLAELRYQISALKGMVESLGHTLNHVKAHGALYNDMNLDEGLASDYVRLVKSIDPQLRILAMAGSHVIDCCRSEGISYIREGFADRRYDAADQLRSRKHPDAVLKDPEQVLAQVEQFLQGRVVLASGESAEVAVDSICLHSDTPGAVELSGRIYNHLKAKHVDIAAHI